MNVEKLLKRGRLLAVWKTDKDGLTHVIGVTRKAGSRKHKGMIELKRSVLVTRENYQLLGLAYDIVVENDRHMAALLAEARRQQADSAVLTDPVPATAAEVAP